MNWLFSFPQVEVLESKITKFSLESIAASRKVSLGFQGWGLVRIRFRQDHRERFQLLTSFWFKDFDQIEIIFPEDAQLSVELVNLWGLLSRSFSPSDWTKKDYSQPIVIVDREFTYTVQSKNLSFGRINEQERIVKKYLPKISVDLLRSRTVNAFWRFIAPRCSPSSQTYTHRHLRERFARIDGFMVVIPPVTNTEKVAPTEGK